MIRKPVVHSRLVPLVVIVWLMTACKAAPENPAVVPSPTNTPEAPTLVPPTSTSSPSRTITITRTSASTSTITQTQTPSRTKNPHKYVFPVQPQESADFAEGGHAYPATDIFIAVGSDFVAVTDGVVDFVSYTDKWDPGTNDEAVAGGLCVAIVGDDGIRYYGSHLSAIAKGIRQGVRVEAGQLLGLTGKSGNAVNTPPHLHFGISHPTYPEDWRTRRGELDPYPYLVAWSRGEDVTPQFPTATPTP